MSFAAIKLLIIDIDGTLTDATIQWGGPDVGFTQSFSVRDGEAIRRCCARGLPVVPLSRNGTLCARTRMAGLGLPLTWLGITEKSAALDALLAHYAVSADQVAYVGDGREDVPLLRRVVMPCSVADGHPEARAVARYVTAAVGGRHAMEEIVDRIFEARGWDA